MDKLEQVNIAKTMEQSFLDYSMSVIVSRALPDLRDGLKPVHRRILYTMYEDNLTPDRVHRKSATTVGAVIGRYHPHGDSAVYDSLVRMAQDFSYRYMLIDGHGNFGSINGYEAAAYRYTEARLSKISLELLRDINKNTVDFQPNFDGNLKEPIVLPSKYPNILVNGTMGIAVGMATNIPPHNLGEVINGCIAYIDNPDIDVNGLMEHIKGPDFPTGAIILGNSGIKKAYETGKGSITIRARASIEDKGNKQRIIVSEIPYQVNTTSLEQKIAELVRDKVIDGISDLHEENVQEGLRIVIDLKRDANANVILNNLYKHTQLQTSYGINLLMLVDGQPMTLGLKSIIEKYIDYQKTIIIRRTKYDLARYQERVHILEGLKIALDHIDEIIKIIKESNDDREIIEKFNKNYNLSEAQSQAILEMKLRRLSGLERSKVEDEYDKLIKLIEELNSILASNEKIMGIIKDELTEIKNKYGDDRRTTIDMTAIEYIEDESLIPVDDVIIALTNKGYIKRMPVDTYRSQNRGGVGIKGMSTNEEDFVENLISMSTHDYIMFFTNLGKVYRIKGYEIPEYGRQSKGLPIVNLLPLEQKEIVTSVIMLKKEEETCEYLLFVTKEGLVKRTNISEFDLIRANGKKAITLKDNDELVTVRKTTGNNEVVIGATNGRMVRVNENEIRSMGRTAVGVKGIDLSEDTVIGAEVVDKNTMLLIVTEKGYGKKTSIEEYRLTHRGSKGVKALNVTEKNGNMVAIKAVEENEDLMIITNSGIIIRMPISQISTLKRATQGVRLINLKDEQKVATVTIIKSEEENQENSEIDEENAS